MNENINSGKLLNEAVQKLELLSEEQLGFLVNSLGEAVDNYQNAGVILQDLMLDVTCYWSELESDDISEYIAFLRAQYLKYILCIQTMPKPVSEDLEKMQLFQAMAYTLSFKILVRQELLIREKNKNKS